MGSKMHENFWTAVLCMLFARIREAKWKNEVLGLSIQTGGGERRLGDMLPFSSHAEVWMCRDLRKALEERGASSAGCSGDPDVRLEDADNVLLIENKTEADRRSGQEESYIRCLRTVPVFASKNKAFFYAIPKRYLGLGNKWERIFLADSDRTVTRGLLLWDDQLRDTVAKVLCLQDWFLREFPS
jgi:hypothetical protein